MLRVSRAPRNPGVGRDVRQALLHGRGEPVLGSGLDGEIGDLQHHAVIFPGGAAIGPTSSPSTTSAVIQVCVGWRRRSVGEPGLSRRSPLCAVVSHGMWLCPNTSTSTSG